MIFVYFFAALYGLTMLFILIYSLSQAHLLFHFFLHKKKPPLQKSLQEGYFPLVTVQLPVFNERYVIERLIDAAAALNYPADRLEIQILDDSTDITTQLIQKKIQDYPHLNIQYLHRKNREGYKAGALKAGLECARGEFIAIFDADFVPDRDFLVKTLPYFDHQKTGMVQTRWTHLNRDYSVLTKLQAFALDAHFFVEQIGRNHQNAFINFNGTGGIWRKECILDAGNWQDDTLTEDLDLSYRAQQKGWNFVYRPEIESPAELPPIMSAIKSQQYRWTKGGAECAKKHIRKVWKGSFSFRIKLHALTHLLNSSVFIAILLGSISSIPLWWTVHKGWLHPVYFKYGAFFLIGFAIIGLVYVFAFFSTKGDFWKKAAQVVWQLPFFLAVSMGLSLHNSLAVGKGLMGKKSTFVRTPKFNLEQRKDDWKRNSYLPMKIPFTAFLEGAMALLFLTMVILSVRFEVYLMLPFHLMLGVGYALVFYTSLKSYSNL